MTKLKITPQTFFVSLEYDFHLLRPIGRQSEKKDVRRANGERTVCRKN